MLFITLDTFSNTGGIQKVCRTLSYVLKNISSDISPKPSFRMLSLYDKYPDKRYIKQNYFQGFDGFRSYFILKAILKGLKSQKIIISHINLLPIALCIKFLHRRSEVIMIAHGTEVWRNIPYWKRKFIQKRVTVWAVSRFTKQILQERHKIHSNNITTLKNCLDPFFKIPLTFNKPEYLLKRFQLSEDQPILLSIARLSTFEKDKGYDTVIKLIPLLLNEFPNLIYFLSGKSDHHEKTRIKELIIQNNLQDHVLLTDFIPEDEITQYYQLADVFILPSRKEGFGLVFIEAAACGCRIISGNTDGSCDAMLDGALGKMIDPTNITEISTAIIQSLHQGPNLHLSSKIQNACLNHFSHQHYQNQVKNLLKKPCTTKNG